jgi:hypothetical protein
MAIVRVTRKHIRMGMPGAVRTCPIANAVRDFMKGYRDGTIAVTDACIWIGPHKFVTPCRASRFIYAFDKGRKVKPFAFRLRSAD